MLYCKIIFVGIEVLINLNRECFVWIVILFWLYIWGGLDC